MGIILTVVILAILAYTVYLYNRIVRLKYLKDEGWSGIDVQLKKRHELIPNLIAVVEGYAKHEKSTLEELTKLRSQSQRQEAVSDVNDTETAISKDLKQIFALAEAYPDLKANESFLVLQSNLAAVENDLQYARRYYNGAVRDYKTALQTFPSSLVASFGNFKDADFFELDSATERAVPVV